MKFEEIKSEVQRVRLIKFGITVAILIIMGICTVVFWDASNIYIIELEANKEDGYEWVYTLSEKNILEENSKTYQDGIYCFEFRGEKSGKTEINFFCIREDNPNDVTEKINYSVRVDKALNIINKTILHE